MESEGMLDGQKTANLADIFNIL